MYRELKGILRIELVFYLVYSGLDSTSGVPKQIPADKAVYFRFMQGARQETHFILLLADLSCLCTVSGMARPRQQFSCHSFLFGTVGALLFLSVLKNATGDYKLSSSPCAEVRTVETRSFWLPLLGCPLGNFPSPFSVS